MAIIVSVSVTIVCVLLDMLTKSLAVKYLASGGVRKLIPHIINLRYVENTGAAFGMLKGQRYIFIGISAVAIIAIFAFIIKNRKTVSPMLCVSLSMVIGGGIGNQIDRIAQGYVVDFLDFAFMDFAVFNVADCFVCVGAFLLAVYCLFIWDGGIFPKKDKDRKTENGDENGNG